MKKFKLFKMLAVLVVLITSVSQVMANHDHVIGVAANNTDDYTMVLNVNRDSWGWYMWEMAKAGLTFEGKKLYNVTYETPDNDKIWSMQFQLYSGTTYSGWKGTSYSGTWKDQKQPLNNTESTNYYNNYIYNYDGSDFYSQLIMNDSRTYFDATGWSETNIRLVISHAGLQKYHDMYTVTGTKLYYTNDLSYWTDAMGVGVVGGETGTGANARVGDQTEYWQWMTDISDKAKEYTGLMHFGMNNNNDNVCYLIVNNGKAGESPTMTYHGENYLTYLNKTQTLNTVLKAAGAGSYSTANSKATINISSYELTGQGSTTQRTPDLSTSESSETVSACRTATTVYEVDDDMTTGYQFDGFYTGANSGDRLDGGDPGTYTFYPTSATTVYARFSEKTFRVDFANDGHGTTTPTSGTNQTVGQITGVSVDASCTGYNFVNWTITSGTGSFASAATTASNTFYPTSAATIQANFTPKSCSITFQKYSGIDGATGTTATYDADMPTVTVPHKIGYKFEGYYDSQTDGNGSGTKYYNADGTSAKNWDKDTEDATTLYAKWSTDTKSFTGSASTDWADADNWSGGVVPTNDWSIVTITRDVDINSGTSAHVGQVLISGGTLEVKGGGSLEVASTITKENGDATETTDLRVSSNYLAQGALIFDNSAGTTRATVDLFTKAEKTGEGYVFQMCAVPMTMVNVSESFAGQGIYTYAWIEGEGWERRNYYYAVFGFEAIALTQSGDHFYYFFRGNLVSTRDLDFTLSKTGTDPDAAGANLFGNSWTAPIRIDKCKISGDADKTIYIYEGGDWADHPVGSATASDVIPAMQAYAVLIDEGSSGRLEIGYDDAVRSVPAASRTEALRAPKRNAQEGMSDIHIRVTGGERTTRLRLCESEQFTDEFDNGWEARYFEGDGRSGQLYAQTYDRMSTLAVPDLEGTVVGFLPGQATDYTISFVGDGKGYYLNDMELEESTLIEEGNTYEFKPNESTNATRFVISRTPIKKTPTSIDEVMDGTNARKLMINGVLYIIRDGRIYNAMGNVVK